MWTNPTEMTFLWLSINFRAKHLLKMRNGIQMIYEAGTSDLQCEIAWGCHL